MPCKGEYKVEPVNKPQQPQPQTHRSTPKSRWTNAPPRTPETIDATFQRTIQAINKQGTYTRKDYEKLSKLSNTYTFLTSKPSPKHAKILAEMDKELSKHETLAAHLEDIKQLSGQYESMLARSKELGISKDDITALFDAKIAGYRKLLKSYGVTNDSFDQAHNTLTAFYNRLHPGEIAQKIQKTIRPYLGLPTSKI